MFYRSCQHNDWIWWSSILLAKYWCILFLSSTSIKLEECVKQKYHLLISAMIEDNKLNSLFTCCVVARVDYYDTSLCSQWTTQQSFIYEWFKIFLFLFVGSTVKPIVNSIISSPPSLLCLLVIIIQSDHWDSSTLAPLERTSFKKSSSPKKPGALAQSLLLQSSPRLEFVHMYERILSSDLYSHSRSRAVQS